MSFSWRYTIFNGINILVYQRSIFYGIIEINTNTHTITNEYGTVASSQHISEFICKLCATHSEKEKAFRWEYNLNNKMNLMESTLWDWMNLYGRMHAVLHWIAWHPKSFTWKAHDLWLKCWLCVWFDSVENEFTQANSHEADV